MTSSIRILNPQTVARIAAGEVVERPASVLKEFVENALDAGATRIAAEIESGGMTRVRVSDDGAGMSPEDLILAVQPHATSKLSDAAELTALETLGFRGEALPSIASVARFSIVSRKRASMRIPQSDKDAENPSEKSLESMAWRVDVEGGQPQTPAPRPAAGPFGTTVEARDLFFNLPPRQKFLKGLATEAAACADVFQRLALTRPDVAFSLRQGRSEIISLPAIPAIPGVSGKSSPTARSGSLSKSAHAAPPLPPSAYFRRAKAALGNLQSAGLIEIDFSDRSKTVQPVALNDNQYRPEALDSANLAAASEADNSATAYRLYGLLSPPTVTRPNRSAIYLTVNGRAVKDRTLTSALLEAFRHLLPPRRFPLAVLYLELPGDAVDINVHPAKSEVRFRSPNRIYALFYHAVRCACGLDSNSANPAQAARTPRHSTDLKNDPYLSASLHPPALQAGIVFAHHGPLFRDGLADQTAARTVAAELQTAPYYEAPSSSTAVTKNTVLQESIAPYGLDQNSAAATQIKPNPPCADFRIIGQAAGSYIVLEDESGVRLIDQHALHERILFERLLRAAHHGARGDAQGLLLPEPLELSAAQAALLSANSETYELLEHLGFDCEPFGPRTLLLRAVPAILKNSSRAPSCSPGALPITAPARLLSDLLEALAASDDPPFSNAGGLNSSRSEKTVRRGSLREKAAYILSCKAAIKAGERLTLDQMQALMDDFALVAGPMNAAALTCPHGRPLAMEISWYQLERAVGRK